MKPFCNIPVRRETGISVFLYKPIIGISELYIYYLWILDYCQKSQFTWHRGTWTERLNTLQEGRQRDTGVTHESRAGNHRRAGSEGTWNNVSFKVKGDTRRGRQRDRDDAASLTSALVAASHLSVFTWVFTWVCSPECVHLKVVFTSQPMNTRDSCRVIRHRSRCRLLHIRDRRQMSGVHVSVSSVKNAMMNICVPALTSSSTEPVPPVKTNLDRWQHGENHALEEQRQSEIQHLPPHQLDWEHLASGGRRTPPATLIFYTDAITECEYTTCLLVKHCQL